jgi:hypothetical protein
MAAGADSIDDLDLLRHGGMTKLFGGVRAPSTLGSFLRCLAWGSVRQIEKAGACCWAGWPFTRRYYRAPTSSRSLMSIPCRSVSTGPASRGAAFGHTKIQGNSVLVRGLNALAATLSTPLAAR